MIAAPAVATRPETKTLSREQQLAALLLDACEFDRDPWSGEWSVRARDGMEDVGADWGGIDPLPRSLQIMKPVSWAGGGRDNCGGGEKQLLVCFQLRGHWFKYDEHDKPVVGPDGYTVSEVSYTAFVMNP